MLRSDTVNWEALHELVALREHAARLDSTSEAEWSPKVDVLETEPAFVVVVELPGLAVEDFSIAATRDSLTISGQRPPHSAAPGCFVRLERGHGRFARTFAFARPIRVDGVVGHFERGLLTVTLPKANNSPERLIPVS